MKGDGEPADRSSRNASLDVGRFLLLIGVIALHMLEAISFDQRGGWALAVQDFSYVAVRVYFITAGYFLIWWRRSYRECVMRPVLRLMPLYLFWLAVYLLYFFMMVAFIWPWTPQALLAGGPAYHLWFLPALMGGLIVVGVAAKAGGCGAPFCPARCWRRWACRAGRCTTCWEWRVPRSVAAC